MLNKKKHPLYETWNNMKSRCFNESSNSFDRYGGRGITVCNRWLRFQNFLDDMESSWKDGLQLDRVNNDGNYEPQNCRWVTPSENMFNTSRATLSEADRNALALIGVTPAMFRSRIYKGWSVEEAMTTPKIPEWKRATHKRSR